jgi:hypothetical protein
MIISMALPGASWSSVNSSFTIPYSALNASLTTSMTAADSFERLLFGLLETLHFRSKDGFITQVNCSASPDARSSSQSVTETATNVFDNTDLLTHQVSFAFTTSPVFNGNNIRPTV